MALFRPSGVPGWWLTRLVRWLLPILIGLLLVQAAALRASRRVVPNLRQASTVAERGA